MLKVLRKISIYVLNTMLFIESFYHCSKNKIVYFSSLDFKRMKNSWNIHILKVNTGLSINYLLQIQTRREQKIILVLSSYLLI